MSNCGCKAKCFILNAFEAASCNIESDKTLFSFYLLAEATSTSLESSARRFLMGILHYAFFIYT